MSEARFNIVFSGQLVPGADGGAVRRNLGQVFRMDADKVEKLFSGKPVVLKKDADQATAMKFRAVMKKAGAVCEMQPVGGESPVEPAGQGAAPVQKEAPAQFTSAPAQSSPASAGSAPSSGDLETVGTIRTGGTGFTGEFDVSPVGTRMEDEHEVANAVNPDISHLSLAPPGTDLEELHPDQAISVPDISHLSLADPEAGKDAEDS